MPRSAALHRAGGFVGALFAVPIAATAEILLEGLQDREVPIAQDPTSSQVDQATDEETNAPADPDFGPAGPALEGPSR